MRRDAKIDNNHQEIVTTLRAAGCGVLSLAQLGHGVPDALVWYKNRLFLFEIKNGSLKPSAQKLTPAEVRFHLAWPGDIWVVNSVEQAYRVLGITMEEPTP